MTRRIPNLFIIGAMKAGTSSLHEYLNQHPDIFMSPFKEPQYFAPHRTRWGQGWGQGNPYPEPGIEWYLRLFEEAGDAKYLGESSVSYTARPWVADCEKRIDAFNPDARFIYIIRDPIERTISHYWYFVADGREDRDMLSAVTETEDYVARSDYAMQVRPYIETFGRERVFVLTLEELNRDPRGTMRRLLAWLDVDPSYPIDTSARTNVGSPRLRQTRRGLVFLDTWLKHWRWKRVEAVLPASVPAALHRVAHRDVLRSEVDATPTIQYLRPILKERSDALVQLLGRRFPEWTTLCDTEDGTRLKSA